MKSILKSAATLALAGAAMAGGATVGTSEKPKDKAKPSPVLGRMKMPTAAAIRKMPPEKQAYWRDRIEKRKHPTLNKSWAHPYLAGQSLAAFVNTRQGRRQEERRMSKMPVGMSTEKWHEMRGFGKISERNFARRRKAA